MMIKLTTKADPGQLRTCADINPDYYRAVEKHLDQLIAALAPPDADPAQYTLEQDGYLVLGEAGDDRRQLQSVGLPTGLLNSWPEYIEVLTLADDSKMYRTAIMYDNDYMMLFYIDSRLFADDQEYQQFLHAYCIT
jgi:hypothetical protein